MLSQPETAATIADVLRRRAAETPGRCAFTFLVDGERNEVSLTYGEVDARARGVARLLLDRGITRPCVLAYPAGLDFIAGFFGCLYANVPAVPAHVPRGRGRDRRIEGIIADCRPGAILSTTEVVARLSENATLPWLATDGELPAADASDLPEIDANGIALLQYTSGSIGTPKGVVIGHQNLMANTHTIKKTMNVVDGSTWVTWLPLFHDMGLAAGILQPLLCGGRCILMSPSAFAQRPARWVEAISRYRATHSGAPNSAYALTARRANVSNLDLSSWTCAFCGGEQIRTSTLDGFAATFAEAGFDARALSPCYGLAEATLLVTGGPNFTGVSRLSVADSDRPFASCGEMQDQRIVIVNPATRTRCAENEVGEIWVAGPNVGRGYWERPDESRETFGAFTSDTKEGPFLRTGDLGFLNDGRLYVSGRLKDMIIVRGRNFYANDIEASVDGCHDSLIPGGAAAFCAEGNEHERVVVVHEVDTPIEGDGAPVISAIRRAIFAEHELSADVVLVRRGAVPRTTSGKVQRRRCRELLFTSELRVIAGSL